MEGKEESEVQKRAQDILQELTHNFHLYAVRWFGLVLSKLGKRLYSNIFVNREKLEEVSYDFEVEKCSKLRYKSWSNGCFNLLFQIRKGFERYPVILLPTHRSYVDFLLLSYVCFTYSLPLPIIAAGMGKLGK